LQIEEQIEEQEIAVELICRKENQNLLFLDDPLFGSCWDALALDQLIRGLSAKLRTDN
jgi:hypothetical protein